MKEEIRVKILQTGAVAVGFAKAGEIDPEVHKDYVKWIEGGNHGEMGYLERHVVLRRNTDHVLPGAKTVISVAFSYAPDEWLPKDRPMIAAYAYFEDYHEYLREILKPVVKGFQERFGGKWRICVDSAPVSERYWAIKSGIGKRGKNGSIIVEGCGGLCFLVEVLTTLEIEADKPSERECNGCGLCVKLCPSGALKGDGSIDARRCINYLTIEKKGEFSDEEKEILSQGKGFLYGCDICVRQCPENKNIKKSQLPKNKEIELLTPDKILKLDDKKIKTILAGSPLLYAGVDKLKRNARIILSIHSKKRNA